ncbi:MAG: GNAT family N-acetyltransferase [Lachnospirales bacterium]
MKNLLIRPAKKEDIAQINDIFNYAIENTNYNLRLSPRPLDEAYNWFDTHKSENYPVLVAEIDKKVVGWASLSHFREYEGYNSTAEVSVYISTEHRHKGIGIRLVTELERLAQRFHILIAVIVDNNTASISLHSRCGFVPMCTIRELAYKNGEYVSVIFMVKKLKNNPK